MITRFHQIRKERLNGERGFTLTELLVVIVIIGILVAIAIPVFLSQRTAAYERAVQSDVRNTITAVEGFYANKNAYPGDFTAIGTGGTKTATTLDTDLKVNVSNGVSIVFTKSSTSPVTYTIVGTHAELGTRTWTYSSATSKTVEAAS